MLAFQLKCEPSVYDVNHGSLIRTCVSDANHVSMIRTWVSDANHGSLIRTMGLWYEHGSLMGTMGLWYEHGSLMRTMGLWCEPCVWWLNRFNSRQYNWTKTKNTNILTRLKNVNPIPGPWFRQQAYVTNFLMMLLRWVESMSVEVFSVGFQRNFNDLVTAYYYIIN